MTHEQAEKIIGLLQLILDTQKPDGYLDAKMDALLAPLDQLEILALKLDKLDARLEYIASTLQVINGRLSDDSQMEILALKLDKLDAKLKGVFAMLEIIAEVPP